MSVLIFGENGTGKEHIAHHLHDKSKRSGRPFVAVDCGSLTKELAPSAFFGHVKGAFTGADSAKKGYFHEAEGGTLFLDEVGNLAPETQQMLLRAIQEPVSYTHLDVYKRQFHCYGWHYSFSKVSI